MSVSIIERWAGRRPGLSPKPGAYPERFAIFVGSHRFLGQELREIGLRTYFREHASDFEVLETRVNLETPAIAHEAMLDLLQRYKDLAGLYVAGGGMEGVITALREDAADRRLVTVCNELTPVSRDALADQTIQTVIATPLELLARKLVDLMARTLEKGKATTPTVFTCPSTFISRKISEPARLADENVARSEIE